MLLVRLALPIVSACSTAAEHQMLTFLAAGMREACLCSAKTRRAPNSSALSHMRPVCSKYLHGMCADQVLVRGHGHEAHGAHSRTSASLPA